MSVTYIIGDEEDGNLLGYFTLANKVVKFEKRNSGRLIHDFKCTNADDMYFGQLASRIRKLKETPEGVENV